MRRARVAFAEISKRKRYHAFISFAGPADMRLARRLARVMSHIGARWPWQRTMNVFVDIDRLGADDPLTTSLKRTLDESERLILLASEEATSSAWVRAEVSHWLGTRDERVLLAHTGGELTWHAGAADFDWDSTNALPRDLFRGVFAERPVWARLRPARRHPLPHAALLRQAAATLAAGIVGVEPQALRRLEMRRYRRRMAGLAALCATAVLATGLAASYAQRAEHQATVNSVQRLLANAAEHAGRLDVALLLTGAAYRRAPDSVARHRLLELAVANPGLRKVFRMPEPGIGPVDAVGFSRDGRHVAAATSVAVDTSSRPAVLLWPATGTGPPHRLDLPDLGGTRATSLAFEPAGQRVAVGVDTGRIAVVPLPAAGSAPAVLLDPHGTAAGSGVERLSWSPAGDRLAATYRDGGTVVWELATRGPVASFAGTATTFAPDGGTLVSLSAGGELLVRDGVTYRDGPRITVGLVRPDDLAFRADGRSVAVGSGVVQADGDTAAVAVVDLPGGTVRPIGGTRGTNGLAYAPADDVVTGNAVIEAAGSPDPLVTVRQPPMTVRTVAADPRAGTVAYGGTWPDGETGAILLFGTRPTSTLGATATRASAHRASAVSPDGRVHAVTGTTGEVSLLDATTGRPVNVQPRQGVRPATALVFSPDGARLAASGGGRKVTVWTLADGEAQDFVLPPSTPDGAPATGLAFSPDGSVLAVAVPGGRLLLLPGRTPSDRDRSLPTGPVCDVAFSPDGHRLAVATSDGAQLWDLDENRLLATYPPTVSTPPTGAGGCTGTVAVRFVLGGTALATVSGTTVTVTNVDTGRAETLPVPERNPAGFLRKNPNWNWYSHLGTNAEGTLLAASTSGATVFLWDLTTMRQLGPMLLSDDQVSAVRFTEDGNGVIALGAYVTTWNLDPNHWLAWMCATVQRQLTPQEWRDLGDGPQPEECP